MATLYASFYLLPTNFCESPWSRVKCLYVPLQPELLVETSLIFLFQLLYLSTLVIRLFIVQLFFSQLQSCFVHWASLMYNHLNKCTFPSTNETSFPPWQNVCLCGRHFSPLFVPFLSLAFIFCLDTRVALYLMKEYHANHFIFFQHPILVQSVYFQLFLS